MPLGELPTLPDPQRLDSVAHRQLPRVGLEAEQEHVASLALHLHLAGIGHETDPARDALEAPPLRRARHRLPWLIVGLLGSAVATFVVARFESALAAKPALAFFVPGLVYLADAIGTQSEAVAVRGLSLSRVGLGLLLPWLLGRLGTDPAYGSGPLAHRFTLALTRANPTLSGAESRYALAMHAAMPCAKASRS